MFPVGLSELVKWITFLLPGWLAIVITGVFTDYGPHSELTIVFSSFLISTISYVSAKAITKRTRHYTNSDAETSIDQREPPVWSIFLISGIIGMVLGLGIQNGTLYSGLRLLPFGLGGPKIGEGRPRTSVLMESKRNTLLHWSAGKSVVPAQDFYRVTLANGGQVFEGFVDRFETGELDTDLYLNPACTVNGSTVTPIAGPGVLIYERAIVSIQLLDREQSDCFKQAMVPAAVPAKSP